MRLALPSLSLALLVTGWTALAGGCAAGAETVVVKSDGGSSEGGAFPLPNGEEPTDASTPSATGIEIKNLSFTSSGNQAEITFVLKNNGTSEIDRVREVVVSFGTAVTFLTSCSTPTWQPGPGKTSSVITLTLYDTGVGTPDLTVPCGSATGDDTTKPWGSSLTLELRGLFKDATPWKAEATASR